MSESLESKLADVLVALNPNLTRHVAFARARRIIDYSRYARYDWSPEYAGRLWAGALTGAKRIAGPHDEYRKAREARDAVLRSE